jgi:hypothetical protein
VYVQSLPLSKLAERLGSAVQPFIKLPANDT